ncbi:MAG TPA: hypothetical protein PLY87_29495 [Planctomycetaceae bacterium]|nr:hypothetical protein [Planctomycetaceae bacterium]HQZ69271.1 hypothetical protein [Planctomycetaceae bacterium]HRA90565.1 hypothetical protein [Planctomycetaceae bacterium]
MAGSKKLRIAGWVLSGIVAAILLTAYLGGATATHVRVGDPFFMPIIMGFVVWIAYGLRQPAVFALATGSCPVTDGSR